MHLINAIGYCIIYCRKVFHYPAEISYLLHFNLYSCFYIYDIPGMYADYFLRSILHSECINFLLFKCSLFWGLFVTSNSYSPHTTAALCKVTDSENSADFIHRQFSIDIINMKSFEVGFFFVILNYTV